MSENTFNAGLRRLGYAVGDMTGHGFRSMASTLLNEQGWNRDAIERQLAHAERDDIRAAYDYAEHLPERRKMMQAWADYLDKLKAGADVVPLFKKAQEDAGSFLHVWEQTGSHTEARPKPIRERIQPEKFIEGSGSRMDTISATRAEA